VATYKDIFGMPWFERLC